MLETKKQILWDRFIMKNSNSGLVPASYQYMEVMANDIVYEFGSSYVVFVCMFLQELTRLLYELQANHVKST